MKSVDDIRKFSSARNIQKSAEPKVNSTKPGAGFSIPRLLLLIGSLLGLPTAYIHFYGFSYLKGKLDGLGFDYVDVNLSIQEGVYLALEGAIPIIESASKYKYLTFDNNILIMMVIPAVIIPIMFYLIQRYIQVIVDKSNKPLFEVFFEGCQSLKGMFLQMPLIAFLVGGAYVIFSVAVMSLILIVWVMAAQGINVGHKEGKRISLEGVCVAPKTLEDSSTYQYCRKIKTAAGQELIGRIIYRNDDYMYFVTNDGAYELTIKREVNMHVEYVKKEPAEDS